MLFGCGRNTSTPSRRMPSSGVKRHTEPSLSGTGLSTKVKPSSSADAANEEHSVLHRGVGRDLAVLVDGDDRGPALAGIAAGADIDHPRVRVLELRRHAGADGEFLHQHARAVAQLLLAAVGFDDLQRDRTDRDVFRLDGVLRVRRRGQQQQERERAPHAHGRATLALSS